MSNTDGDTNTPSTGPIVARAGKYFRVTRYIMAAFIFGYGLYSIYDGFFKYPRLNREYLQKERAAAVERGLDPDKSVDPTKVPHPGLDVPFNQFFGVLLPPLAIALLARWLHLSRGEYRLEGRILHVPAHPPIPLDSITEVDKRLWDRKGIAFVGYELPDGKKGRVKLDDFIYDRKPTDEIYDRIVAEVAPESISTESVSSASDEPTGANDSNG
jgi:hypothetical protein